ncbi:hypothetical protein HOLleu_11350 [Holothuria leucospilota]|uniref:Uncharacterized protein n=1 Tax=Holothuria leucospilota TaxID=206669 RepID=A0A9Q1CG21_HOLLE|nr:hypothetical protein HOLleu_11350 [Holothuria leucospilota]
MQTDSTTTTETDSTTTDLKQKTKGRGRQEKVQAVAMAMEQLMKSLEMTVTKQASTKWNPRYDLVANTNTWSHQRKKRRLAKMKKKHRDMGDSDEIRGSNVKPHVKLCSSQVLDTPDMNDSKLKFDKDCSENTTSQVKPVTSPPAGGVNCVKIPLGGSNNFQHSNQSEQVREDMQTVVNAERGYHSNNVNFMSKEENGADEAEIVQCDEKSICQKNSVQSAKRVKWKEDEIRKISDFEPAKKRKRLVYKDGFPCFPCSDAGEDRITLIVDGDCEMTCDNCAGQKENGTSHSKLSMENVSPASMNQVQNEACDGQSKTKSICGSIDVHLSSGESEFCKNKGENCLNAHCNEGRLMMLWDHIV